MQRRWFQTSLRTRGIDKQDSKVVNHRGEVSRQFLIMNFVIWTNRYCFISDDVVIDNRLSYLQPADWKAVGYWFCGYREGYRESESIRIPRTLAFAYPPVGWAIWWARPILILTRSSIYLPTLFLPDTEHSYGSRSEHSNRMMEVRGDCIWSSVTFFCSFQVYTDNQHKIWPSRATRQSSRHSRLTHSVVVHLPTVAIL